MPRGTHEMQQCLVCTTAVAACRFGTGLGVVEAERQVREIRLDRWGGVKQQAEGGVGRGLKGAQSLANR